VSSSSDARSGTYTAAGVPGLGLPRGIVLTVVIALAACGCSTSALGGREPDQRNRGALIFQDNFNGKKLDTRRWEPYFSPGNAGNGLRRPSAFSLDGKGHLVVTAKVSGGQIVSGGMAATEQSKYGRFEVRVRTEPDPSGIMSGVVLTWPSFGRWPQAGENDIYETGTARNRRRPFHSYIHYGADNSQYSFTHKADGARWHTLMMDWRANAIRIYRDGRLVWTVTDRRAIPDVTHHLTIQLDAMRERDLRRPVRMYVDYVRVWR
jgi:beta-glucanase (GH16 family)